MIKPAALGLAVAMGAVSAGTYYGLDMLPPGTIPEPFGLAQKQDAPQLKPAEVASAAPAAAPAPAPAPAPATPEPTEQDLAEEPPPPEQPPAAAAAPAPEPAPAPAPPPAEPEPAPKAAAAPKYETPPALRDDIAEPAPKPKPRPKAAPQEPTTVAKAQEPQSAPAPAKPRPPEADALKPWWPDPSKMPANQLKLMYAGQVQGQQAIALLFSSDLNLETVQPNAQVLDPSGKAVGGQWELGKNARLAVFRGTAPGRYTVVLKPEVAGTNGFMLGTTLKGPVYIKE